jgi:flagella basal body P-ring formation protein FlgA
VTPVYVREDNVLLGEIGKISSTRTQDREEIAALSVAQIPQGKESIVLPASYIESRVREVLGKDRQIEFEMPDDIELRRVSMKASRAQIADGIERMAEEQRVLPTGAKAKVEIVEMPSGLEYPRGSAFVIEQVGNKNWHGPALFRVEVREPISKSPHNFFMVQAKIRWFSQRWVGVRDIPAGTRLSVSDFQRGEIEIFPTKDSMAQAQNDENLEEYLRGARLLRPLRTGQPLLPGQFARIADISNGSRIRIRIKSAGGLSVETPGLVMGGARIGEPIKAKIVKSGKVVTGKLIDSDSMEISL